MVGWKIAHTQPDQILFKDKCSIVVYEYAKWVWLLCYENLCIWHLCMIMLDSVHGHLVAMNFCESMLVSFRCYKYHTYACISFYSGPSWEAYSVGIMGIWPLRVGIWNLCIMATCPMVGIARQGCHNTQLVSRDIPSPYFDALVTTHGPLLPHWVSKSSSRFS